MLSYSPAVSGCCSVDDLDAARTFYADVLGLTVRDAGAGYPAVSVATAALTAA